MPKQELLEYLKQTNPWWRQKEYVPPENSLPQRELFAVLQNYLKNNLMVALTGLRRTGKTTLLKQTISYLLCRQKINPINILFFNFEEHFISLTPQILEELINVYLDSVLKKELYQVKNKVYIFLDEIQYIEKWQSVLKRFYDLNSNFKFIVSGSASLFIKKRTDESLAGRIFELNLEPLSFKEFLEFKYSRKTDFSLDILKLSIKHINNLRFDWSESKDLDGYYRQYLIAGAFPEALHFTEAMRRAYIKDSILKKLIDYDMPKLYPIAEPQSLKILAEVLIKESGNLAEFQNLAGECGIGKDTVMKYINYLDSSNLIKLFYSYSKSARPAKRRFKKVYAASANFTSAYSALPDKILIKDNISIGHLLETDIFNKLHQRFLRDGAGLSFWRRQNQEVDFIIKSGEKIIPCEVKLKVRRPADLKVLQKVMAKFKSPYGIVFSLADLEAIKLSRGENVFIVPSLLV